MKKIVGSLLFIYSVTVFAQLPASQVKRQKNAEKELTAIIENNQSNQKQVLQNFIKKYELSCHDDESGLQVCDLELEDEESPSPNIPMWLFLSPKDGHLVAYASNKLPLKKGNVKPECKAVNKYANKICVLPGVNKQHKTKALKFYDYIINHAN